MRGPGILTSMATRKTQAEAASAAPAVRKRSTSATHTAPARAKAAVAVTQEEPFVITREEIAAVAYSYWEARGRQGGSEAEDWLRAEQELRRRARETSTR